MKDPSVPDPDAPVELTIENDETGPFVYDTRVAAIVRPLPNGRPKRIELDPVLEVPAGKRISLRGTRPEVVE